MNQKLNQILNYLKEAKAPGRAFLVTGAFGPYTRAHEEMARAAAVHAASTGHTHFYHGIGASELKLDAPLTHEQKTEIVSGSHKHISDSMPKEHRGRLSFGIVPKEHSITPFHQIAHLVGQGHKDITVAVGSDQLAKGGLKERILQHMERHGGFVGPDKQVHDVKINFYKLGKDRVEGQIPREDLLKQIRGGEYSGVKAGKLRDAILTGDEELAHEMMPHSVQDKAAYFKLIRGQMDAVQKGIDTKRAEKEEKKAAKAKAKPKTEPKKKKLKEAFTKIMTFLSEDMPIEHPAASVGYQYSTKPKMEPNIKHIEHLGNIGPYEVHHFKDSDNYDASTVTVHHDGKQIGVFKLVSGGRRGGKPVVAVDTPNIHREHRGKKAKVPNLASKVYGMIADKFGGVISGPYQTKGSRSLWANLAKQRPVSVVNDSRKKGFTTKRYNPERHDPVVYHPTFGQNMRLLVLGRKKRSTVKESLNKIFTFLEAAKDPTRKERDHRMYGWGKKKPTARQLANRKKKDKRTVARRKANASGRTRKGDKSVELDHKNGNANDNSPDNLRVISRRKNRSRNNNKWRK